MIFKTSLFDEKNAWMACFSMLKSKPNLEAALDAILFKDRTENPLKLPQISEYPFVEPDSPENIVFKTEEMNMKKAKGDSIETGSTVCISGATMVKLVEKITNPSYSTPKLIKQFLITYRSFLSPNELLELLINRFKIPEPEWNK